MKALWATGGNSCSQWPLCVGCPVAAPGHTPYAISDFAGQPWHDTIGLYGFPARMYDPYIGQFTQPASFAGPPEAPQGLNRYAMPAIPTFSVGVPLAGGSVGLGDLLSVLANKTLGHYADRAELSRYFTLSTLRAVGQRPGQWGSLSLEVAQKTLRDAGYWKLFVKGGAAKDGRYLFTSSGAVDEVGEYLYRTVGGQTINLKPLMENTDINPRWLRNVAFQAEMETVWREVSALGRWTGAVRWGLDNALPFGVDVLWQIGTDWNADMPFGYRIGRATVAGGVGYATGKRLAMPIANYVAVSVLGSASAPWWLTIGVGLLLGSLLRELLQT